MYNQIISWLLKGDPAIIYQVHRDLLNSDREILHTRRKEIEKKGWGKRLLAHRAEDGIWGGGLYSPKWISTTYTLLLLRRLGLPPANKKAKHSSFLLLENGLYEDGGINFAKTKEYSDVCVTAMILSLVCYFNIEDERVENLIDYLIEQQMNDGGWNCDKIKGAVHSSVHTTLSVLESFLEYKKVYNYKLERITECEKMGQEFLLKHRLYKSDKTEKVINKQFTMLSFPPRWKYDILRALDYFRSCNHPFDSRMNDALELLKSKQRENGKWPVQNRHSGKVFFQMERTGSDSRWNTLRAVRVLNYILIY